MGRVNLRGHICGILPVSGILPVCRISPVPLVAGCPGEPLRQLPLPIQVLALGVSDWTPLSWTSFQ